MNTTFLPKQNEIEFKSIIINSTGCIYCLGAAEFFCNDCSVDIQTLLLIVTKMKWFRRQKAMLGTQ